MERVFEALASTNRRKILAYLAHAELTAGEIASRFAMSKPAVSQHLSVLENAGLIATHLEAAGDLRSAFGWHMRAADWLTNRDIGAARASWLRAREVADRLPDDDPDRTSMRIAPRTLLCGHAWRAGGAGVADTGFEELRELCGAAGDQMSLVMGMSGVLVSLLFNHRHQD